MDWIDWLKVSYTILVKAVWTRWWEIPSLLGYSWTGQIISGGKRSQWFSFLVFVAQNCWVAIDWNEWSCSSDWMATEIINTKQATAKPFWTSRLVVDLCFHELSLFKDIEIPTKTLTRLVPSTTLVSISQYHKCFYCFMCCCFFVADIHVSLD